MMTFKKLPTHKPMTNHNKVADKVPAGANKNGSKVLFIRLLIPTEK